MQKQRLIPTPLRVTPRPPVKIAAAQQPTRFHLLKIVAFVASLGWFWWSSSFSLLFTGRARTLDRARKAREFLENMGGLWIKCGQIVAMRRDMFLKDTCDELSGLQDQATGFSWEHAKRILEAELGGPIEDTFSEFNQAPVAAASIGQTYQARLRKNGVRVAVKVQRPFAAKSFARDLRYARFVASWLRRMAVATYGRWDEMVVELEKTMQDELDYRLEASSIARMRKTLRAHKIYVPKVYLQCCTRRVLVMEFVEGVFMSDYIHVANTDPERLQLWLAENNIDPKKVGERLIISRNRQLFEDNRYHADMHPGNILLQRDSRIALIDFGSVGTLDRSLLEKYQLLIAALTSGNYAKVADLYLLMCPPLPHRDTSQLKQELMRTMRTWEAHTVIKNLPYHEKSLSSLSVMMSGLQRQFQVPSNWEFLRLTRADLTMDSSLLFLVPKINYIKALRKYQKQARARQSKLSSKRIKRSLASLTTAVDVSAMVSENLYFNGEWLRQRALGFEGKISKLAYVAQGLLSLLAAAAMGSGIFLLWHWLVVYFQWSAPDPFSGLPHWGPQWAVVVVAAMLYAARKLTQIRHHVVEKDFHPPGRLE